MNIITVESLGPNSYVTCPRLLFGVSKSTRVEPSVTLAPLQLQQNFNLTWMRSGLEKMCQKSLVKEPVTLFNSETGKKSFGLCYKYVHSNN
jgi:hypothetical protein